MGWLRQWLNVDRVFLLAFSGLYLALAYATLPSYGLAWDAWEFYLGDQNLAFYATLDTRYLDYAVPQPDATGHDLHDLKLYHEPGHPNLLEAAVKTHGNPVLIWPHQVWPLGATVACLGKLILYGWFGMDVFDATHAVIPLYGLLLIWLLYGWVQRRVGRWEAIVAVVVLTCHPRWWAHLHNNFKDVPAVWLYALAAICFYEGMERRRWTWLIGSSVAWGVGMATKGNALLLPLVLIPWFLFALVERWRERREPGSLLARGEWIALGVYPVLGLAVMFVLWPYLLADYPHHLVDYVQSLFERGLAKESDKPGWQGWVPPVNALVTTPLPMLLTALAGVGVTVRKWWRDRRPDGFRLLLVLWLVVPIGRVMLPGARDFDVIRHWLEVLVPIAVFSGIGAAAGLRWLWRRLGAAGGPEEEAASTGSARRHAWIGAVAVALLVSPTIVWNVRNHPNNLVFYNCLVGGLPGARRLDLPEATDYWAGGYRQGDRWINANAPEGSLLLTGVAEHLTIMSRQVWLRPDIKVLPLNGVDEQTYLRGLDAYPNAVYLMYIIHPTWYYPAVWGPDANLKPVYEVDVEGAPILRIVRLK